jgi:DNA topoisomerase IB
VATLLEHPTRRQLRRSDPTRPGITRRRSGRGFAYYTPSGRLIKDRDVLARIKALVIPPAWRDVWISPSPRGHLQAIGTDAAGRRQYLYHELWRTCRDQEKFGRMTEFARSLPRLRRRVARDLASDDLGRDQVLAAAVRLLDLGLFRVGGEAYAARNGTFGLATLRKDHVTAARDGAVWFRYHAKGGIERMTSVHDADIHRIVRRLKRHRHRVPDLLVYRNGDRRWRDVRSHDINDYIKEASGGDFTAKDFRTWHATVLAALGLARVVHSPNGKRNPVPGVIRDVAAQLGNTPAVCRASYIHPNVLECFAQGVVVDLPAEWLALRSYPLPMAAQHVIEGAVTELLERFEEQLAPRAVDPCAA